MKIDKLAESEDKQSIYKLHLSETVNKNITIINSELSRSSLNDTDFNNICSFTESKLFICLNKESNVKSNCNCKIYNRITEILNKELNSEKNEYNQ